MATSASGQFADENIESGDPGRGALPDPDASIGALLDRLVAHEERHRACFHLTPSENVLSPLARLPFSLDAYSRYFFVGSTAFHGSRELGWIERELLIPLLRQLAGAEHVDVRPIAGLNCMTAVIAALCRPGRAVLTVPLEQGGHMSTSTVAARLGAVVEELPMRGPFDIDLDRLEARLARSDPPDLIYFDQSTQLFPLDPAPVRALVDRHAPATLIHYDSSHVNGLILGGALANPLARGAHSFGGSTHKTLPGPHKGFLATNQMDVAARLRGMTEHFISHHHMAEVVSLAITLVELRDCGGDRYARAVIENARTLARALQRRGLRVAAADRGFTGCHQIWAALDPAGGLAAPVERLYRAGLVVNSFPGLPGIDGPCLRLSVAELTRLGATEADVVELADVMCAVLAGDEGGARARVEALRARLCRPRYCFELSDLALGPATAGVASVSDLARLLMQPGGPRGPSASPRT